MADKIEQADIRGLQIDKTIKGIAEIEYTFKNDLTTASMSGDSLRWYQETFGTLSATSPSRTANVAALATPTTLEQSWTRNTSYSRKYMAQVKISEEDIRTADIAVLARSLRSLVQNINSQVDARIFSVVTQGLADPATTGATAINMVTTSGGWTDAASNPIRDLLEAQRVIWVSGGYNSSNPVVWLSPKDHANLKSWLIYAKGSSIPQFASSALGSGVVLSMLGINFKVSPNVTADYAVMLIPQLAGTWYSSQGMTSSVIDDAGIGKTIRVWEDGEAILTAPKAVCLISNTQ